MSQEPDELEIENQKGYDEGMVKGFNDGIQAAAMVMMNQAGEHFKNGNDKLASHCRDQYDRIRMELKEIPKQYLPESE